MYPDFVTWEDQPAYRTRSLISTLFLEQSIKHFVGPILGTNCPLKISLSQPLGGGGGGSGSSTANSISAAGQKDRVMVHRHVFEIKEADYQTTCCCCFKTRVARGGFGRTKADLAHKT